MENSKMATRRKNTVHVVGYLKENTLEAVKDKNGADIIRGALTVAVSESNSVRFSFYCKKLKKDGSENKDYTERLAKLLPANTLTIASYLKANTTANFATASNMSTKVWVRGNMEEYVYEKEGKQRSMVTFRGASAGIKELKDGTFLPHAQFEADIYIEKITPEMKKASADASAEETGRLIVTGLIPNWDGNMFRIDFVAPVENNVAEHIKDNYHPTETVSIKGDLLSIQEEVMSNTVSNDNWFGTPREVSKTYNFRRERIITGGSNVSIPSGEPGSISVEEVRKGLTTRETKITDSLKRAAAKDANKNVGFGTASITTTTSNNTASAPSLDDFPF